MYKKPHVHNLMGSDTCRHPWYHHYNQGHRQYPPPPVVSRVPLFLAHARVCVCVCVLRALIVRSTLLTNQVRDAYC